MKPLQGYISGAFWAAMLMTGWAVAGPHPAEAAPNKLEKSDQSEKEGIPMAARTALSQAVRLIDQKAYDKAIDTLKAFQSEGASAGGAESDPKGRHHPEIYFTLGTCYLFADNYRQAVRALEKALEKDPGHVSAWLNLAKARYELGDYAGAAHGYLKAYDAVAEKKPEYLYFSAAAYLMAQKNDLSIAAFQRLFTSHPDRILPEWLENFIHALLTAGRSREALPHIRRMAEEVDGGKKDQWQEILLQQYMQLDMRHEARVYAGSLARQHLTRSKWWKALAHVELQDGKYKPALVALTVCSYIEPLTDPETKLLADLHLQLGIPVKAAPLYEKSLQNQFNDRVLQNLMLALQQSGRAAAALDALQRFAPRTNDPELLMLKADLLYGLSDFKTAAPVYRKVAEAGGRQKGRAWLMAGYAAFQAGDIPFCRSAFERAAAFDQHRDAARTAMQRLPKPAAEASDRDRVM